MNHDYKPSQSKVATAGATIAAILWSALNLFAGEAAKDFKPEEVHSGKETHMLYVPTVNGANVPISYEGFKQYQESVDSKVSEIVNPDGTITTTRHNGNSGVTERMNPEGRKKKKFPWLLVAGGAIAAGVILYLVTKKGGSSEEPQQQKKARVNCYDNMGNLVKSGKVHFGGVSYDINSSGYAEVTPGTGDIEFEAPGMNNKVVAIRKGIERLEKKDLKDRDAVVSLSADQEYAVFQTKDGANLEEIAKRIDPNGTGTRAYKPGDVVFVIHNDSNLDITKAKSVLESMVNMKKNVQENTEYGKAVLTYKIGDSGKVDVYFVDVNSYGAGTTIGNDNTIIDSVIQGPGKASLVDVLKTFAEVQSATQSNVVNDGMYAALIKYNESTDKWEFTDLGKATELFHAYFGNDIALKGISSANFSAPVSVPSSTLNNNRYNGSNNSWSKPTNVRGVNNNKARPNIRNNISKRDNKRKR
ncbi:MAG: hypothetical protein JXI33_06680 [Candidatus Aminicenantes bacterium]|nr:hypothetical protein [Candidatus Aminicenantes bacterium]